MLNIISALPDGFLNTDARDLHRILDGPTLIHLSGRRSPALFVSILLHGNEDSGFVGIQQVLREHAERELPRAMSLLIGNVEAAKHNVRRLNGQPDYNRVWPGTKRHAGTPEATVMADVHRHVAQRGLFACIDIHNNTGLNPHYSVVNRIDDATLQLALLFSRTVVIFDGLAGTQTNAFAALCPAITIECGLPGITANAQAAARLVTAALHMSEFPVHRVRSQDIDLYRSIARVKVRDGISLDFGEEPADINFDPALELMNFQSLQAGTVFAHTRHPSPIEVRDGSDIDVTDQWFSSDHGTLTLIRPAMPAMLTQDKLVVRQDCLCYLMRPANSEIS